METPHRIALLEEFGGILQLITRPDKSQRAEVKRIASESFCGDELFASFGDGARRRELVTRYMDCYVDFAIAQKVLWANDGFNGFVALLGSHEERFLSTSWMLLKLRMTMPRAEYGGFLAYCDEISNDSEPYKQRPYLEMLMLCVDPTERGHGLGRELFEFSKQRSIELGLPLVIDTDMLGNAQMYQHLGCELMGTRRGSNGVTRFNFAWYPPENPA